MAENPNSVGCWKGWQLHFRDRLRGGLGLRNQERSAVGAMWELSAAGACPARATAGTKLAQQGLPPEIKKTKSYTVEISHQRVRTPPTHLKKSWSSVSRSIKSWHNLGFLWIWLSSSLSMSEQGRTEHWHLSSEGDVVRVIGKQLHTWYQMQPTEDALMFIEWENRWQGGKRYAELFATVLRLGDINGC